MRAKKLSGNQKKQDIVWCFEKKHLPLQRFSEANTHFSKTKKEADMAQLVEQRIRNA